MGVIMGTATSITDRRCRSARWLMHAVPRVPSSLLLHYREDMDCVDQIIGRVHLVLASTWFWPAPRIPSLLSGSLFDEPGFR